MDGMTQAGGAQPSEGERWSGNDLCRAWPAAIPPAAVAPVIDAASRARLLRTIETEVIPRLRAAHRTPRADAHPEGPGDADARAVSAFAAFALADDFRSAFDYVETLRVQGTSLERLCGDLFAPAARLLGVMWDTDQCDFAQVTLALWCLQQVLRESNAAFASELEQSTSAQGMRTLLVPTPGEEHTLGLTMVVEFFRRAGWDVEGSPPATVADLRRAVTAAWFDVVGLSVSGETRLDVVRQSIVAVRTASLNGQVTILVGGALCVSRPDIAAVVGADMAITNGAQGPIDALLLVARRKVADRPGKAARRPR